MLLAVEGGFQGTKEAEFWGLEAMNHSVCTSRQLAEDGLV